MGGSQRQEENRRLVSVCFNPSFFQLIGEGVPKGATSVAVVFVWYSVGVYQGWQGNIPTHFVLYDEDILGVVVHEVNAMEMPWPWASYCRLQL